MSSSPSAPSSSAPGSPTPQKETPSWQERLAAACECNNLPTPKFNLMSDRRGGRTAWKGVVYVAGYKALIGRFYFDGHYNAQEDAAELMLKDLDINFKLRQNESLFKPNSNPTTVSSDLLGRIEDAGAHHAHSQSLPHGPPMHTPSFVSNHP
ncbi:hypothetical protein FN846DRAFT_908233 [Sphaerosporella brunnea]|uniref:DRBM domain-containing protein n=1 Tax=Sphaerosporella brunnea TaxID=1250544 RepID=A0A5J5ETT0_9PEZI|nr:hypothetical protein FN846DRAFT_908233 [Sphaerosporella brunnea]